MEVSKCWKLVQFPKILIKVKNFETFSPPPVKSFLRLWNKNFQMKIFTNIQKFALQVFRKCSSWGSRNGAVQTFILTPNWNMFLTVLREYIFIMLSELRFVEWIKFFERNCIVQLVIFFASFRWLETFYQKIWN